MKKKLIITSIIIFLIILLILITAIYYSIKIFEYKKYTSKSYKMIPYCQIYDNTGYFISESVSYGNYECFEKMYHLLLPKLLVYKAIKNNKSLNDIYKVSNAFSILDNSIISSDAILSWGIGEENEVAFEEFLATRYKIPIYLFDCGTEQETIDRLSTRYKVENKNICIQNECIGTDKYLVNGAKSSHKIHTFSQKLKELNLQDKKVYIKLGIPEPQEYIEDILKNKDNITAISVVVDMWSSKHCIDLLKLFNALNNDFALISRNPISKENSSSKRINHNMDTIYPKIKYINSKNAFHYSLLYVNKKYIDSSYLPLNQNNQKTGNAINITINHSFSNLIIDPTVVMYEKIKILKNKFKK